MVLIPAGITTVCMANRKTILHWVFTVLWLLIGAGTIVLLVAAIKKKDAQLCSGISINIEGVDNNFFVDKKDITNAITNIVHGSPVGETISAFDLKEMESQLEKDVWIKTAQLFFDNNNRLMVNVLEREPLARVFTTIGTTFYIDSSLSMLPLSEKFSARLPVFTGFPSNKGVLSKADSALLKDILNISMAIQKDTFRTAIIDQVDITPQRSFQMVPKIGNEIIAFGDATNLDEKFNKLQLFYQQVMVKAGWNKYSEINVQYNGQIVAKRKGAEDKSADSLRTLQLMQAIAENAERQASDSLQMIAQDNENNSTNINLVQESMERDDAAGVESASKSLPVFPVVVPPVIVKPTVAKSLAIKKVAPKVVAIKKSVVLKSATIKPAAGSPKHLPVNVKKAVKSMVIKTKSTHLPPLKPVVKPPNKIIIKKATSTNQGNEY